MWSLKKIYKASFHPYFIHQLDLKDPNLNNEIFPSTLPFCLCFESTRRCQRWCSNCKLTKTHTVWTVNDVLSLTVHAVHIKFLRILERILKELWRSVKNLSRNKLYISGCYIIDGTHCLSLIEKMKLKISKINKYNFR